jgi:YrbI family 3-deoxy-D-manno-octulosonate 8-phosphate phosphatase
MDLKEKALNIKAVVLDIDGVLTNGRIGYGESDEIKFFHVRDGHGIKLAMRAGLKVGALSGRSAEANRKRAQELSFDFIYEGRKDKRETFKLLLEENHLLPEECLYMGDDVVDIPVMKEAGIAVAVADACSELEAFCDFRTKLPGGKGAVREVLEWLLKEQGKWEELMKKYVS